MSAEVVDRAASRTGARGMNTPNDKVVSKEGERERGKERSKESEKGKKQENTDIDIRYRRPVSGCLSNEDFFSGEYDAVDLAMCVTRGTRKDRALWRKYLRNGSIDEGDFLQCVFQQWRENESDGEPDNSAACLQSKLNPFRKGVA